MNKTTFIQASELFRMLVEADSEDDAVEKVEDQISYFSCQFFCPSGDELIVGHRIRT